jgi:hypothetical protein
MLLVIISAAILFWLRRRLLLNASGAGAPAIDRTAKNLSLVATVLWFAAVIAGRLIAYLSTLYR